MRSPSPKHLAHGREGKWDPAGVLLDKSVARGRVDPRGFFDNDRPVELEIGTGKGTFLLARAAARPDLNFIGIEWARAYCIYAADRFRRAGLTNVRMLRADAAAFVKDCLPDRSIFRLHVYFPDPWPKRRHHRRRLIQPGFVEQARRILQSGGQLLVVTDHLGYFRHIRGVLLGAAGFVRTPMPKPAGQDHELVGTNFERKYIAQGRSFHSIALMRYI
jgi:tRNA (guanine-N7-)-methyltransferase